MSTHRTNKSGREKHLKEATSANEQKLLDLEQFGLLYANKPYEKSLKWLKDLHGYHIQIDQPSVNWKKNIWLQMA